ncbi:hypothetical protein MAMC_01010 [Methylacidimicrobium cyclopophantes]|uniref:Uncharacterized protein n=1 Tax=Methylacidimicrobium cyclopophantes TaxID=1041766 RepID=A0A5E6MJK2_9BACT|nr:hypothetical protein [Methylacidimicrobium cyclopophantes]VVM06247.1 hypothetical protein MAMC_01010 [Methylacidimicrobium cyclopophantes]
MGEYARPIEVRGGKGGGELRAPQMGPLSSTSTGPDYAGASLGSALGQLASGQQSPDEGAKLGPIGQVRQAAQAVTAKAVEGLRSVGEEARKMERNLQQAVGEGLAELRQRALEIFTTRYRPSGFEVERQQRDFERSKLSFHQMLETGRLAKRQTEHALPPLETEGLPRQPHPARLPEQQQEQKRQIVREGRNLGDR